MAGDCFRAVTCRELWEPRMANSQVFCEIISTAEECSVAIVAFFWTSCQIINYETP
jgi:hypothetical protein